MNEPLKAYLYVGLGSALGGVARFWLAGLIGWRFHPTIGVLFVNVTGSFLIGLIAGLTSARSAPVTKWFLMTGERVSGEQLLEMGLVNFLVEDSEIFDKALACADQLAAGPAEAISASKVPINHYIRMISNLVLPLSLSLEGQTMRSQDAKEAQRAFVEKRPPTFGIR